MINLIAMRALVCSVILVFSWSALEAQTTVGRSPMWPGKTLEGKPCRGKPQGFGPFDYTDPRNTVAGMSSVLGSKDTSPLFLVEKAHFTPDVENLISGNTSSIMGDLDYTLRAFPNHHRALWSLIRYSLLHPDKSDTFQGRRKKEEYPPPECYLQRAERFAPHDSTVPFLFAIYLHKKGLLQKALEKYMSIEAKMQDNPEYFYNVALLFHDLGRMEEARKYGKKAYQLGYPLQGLRRLLGLGESSKKDE